MYVGVDNMIYRSFDTGSNWIQVAAPARFYSSLELTNNSSFTTADTGSVDGAGILREMYNSSPSVFNPRDLIQVSGARHHQNNGVYLVSEVNDTTLTIESNTKLTGTLATASSTTTVDLNSVSGFAPSPTDGYYDGWTLTVTGDTNGNDGTYTVLSYASRVLTLSSPLNTADLTGDTITLSPSLASFVQTSFIPDEQEQDDARVSKVKVSVLKCNGSDSNADGTWDISTGWNIDELNTHASTIGTNVNRLHVVQSDLDLSKVLPKDLYQYYILDTKDNAHVTLILPTSPPNGTEITVVKKGASENWHGIVDAGDKTFDGDDDHKIIDQIPNNEKFTLVYDSILLTWYIL